MRSVNSGFMASTASVYTRSTVDRFDLDFDEVSGAGLPVRVNWCVAGFVFLVAGIAKLDDGGQEESEGKLFYCTE